MDNLIENNRIIAEFMGFKRGYPNMAQGDLTFHYVYPHGRDGVFDEALYAPTIGSTTSEGHVENIGICERHHLEKYKFHTSWGWLMPVVKKCIAEDAEFIEAFNACNLDLDKVYQEVLAFIKSKATA